MSIKTGLISSVSALLLMSCSQAEAPKDNGARQEASSQAVETLPPNFIVLIGDDMSQETIGCFNIGVTVNTPNLDRLCQAGMRFDNFWAQAVCSPTRASILSGQYGFRNGVGTPAISRIPELPRPQAPTYATFETNIGSPRPEQGLRAPAPGLKADAFTLPMALKAVSGAEYETLAFGKWHLADSDNGGINHPNLAGFDHYHGPVRGGGVPSFFAWDEIINGVEQPGDTGWADSAKVDDALSYLEQRERDDPFLLWMAFNAPHTPFHKPPVALLNTDSSKALDPNDITLENQHLYYYAMIEALDTEIGRLLDGIDRDTLANSYVIFIGDNGTPEQVASAPFDFYHAKGSMTEGGINVPFFMAGPDVKAGVATPALSNSVDIYATLVDLAGGDISAAVPARHRLDGVSLAPVLDGETEAVRDFAYSDVFGLVPKGIVSERAIRNATHKLIMHTDGKEFLFRIEDDPYETRDLMEGELTAVDRAALDSLREKLAALK